MKQSSSKQVFNLKTLTKSTVWDIQENDVFRMLDSGSKDVDIKDNLRHYIDIIRSAFSMEELSEDKPEIRKPYEKQGYKVGTISIDDNSKMILAIRKRPIMRVTDLTYENIRHISATKLIEVLERNFGGGWDSLSQSIQDIIESGFDISTTTLPKDRLHKKGGMYDKKVADGYEVLEVEKGTWVEAIFAKLKPEVIKPRMKFDLDEEGELSEDEHFGNQEEEEIDDFNEDDITEDNYRTTFTIESDPDEEAEELSEFGSDE
ncbi:MAG: hypothetical protein IKZ62_07745 [Prevotella sp.]|nr:hypothetical protein [Prevotella sp.]